jgi:hypothetical protein
MDKIDIETPRKWVGRRGLNLRLKLEIWQNLLCTLDDPRGIESNGYPMWEFWHGEPCDGCFRTRKKLKAHYRWHEDAKKWNYDGTQAI